MRALHRILEGLGLEASKKRGSAASEITASVTNTEAHISDETAPELLSAINQFGMQRVQEPLYTPVFYYDGLMNNPKVIHNHDFMKNPRYVHAYQKGYDILQHDHKQFWRLHVALWCAAQAARLSGHFVECGVWRGFLSTAIMNYIAWPMEGRNFYLFDSWEGLDETNLTENEQKQIGKVHYLKKFYENQYDEMKAHYAQYENVVLIKGMVPETLAQVEIDRIAYLSIDMNCALPEIAAAECFWEKIVPGGMILLDDYGFVSYEDQKTAFDRFAKQRGLEILALPTGQGLMIK